MVNPIPEGYSTLTPYIIVKGAAKALVFYSKALGASELFRMPNKDGRICHAEMQIGNSRFMLADEFPEMDMLGPETLGRTSVKLLIYVDDVDNIFKKAIAMGATVKRPIENQFYGDRTGAIIDPFGHEWTIATHVEDLTAEEVKKRSEAWMKENS